MNTLKHGLMIFVLVLVMLIGSGPSQACSIFTVVRDGQVLMGNNEDYIKPGVIWFVPGRKNRLGRVNVGFDTGFAQGSMNEKGLAFDGAAVSPIAWEPDPDKKTPKNLVEKIMNECGTVAEAIQYFETYNAPFLKDAQLMFADATGDSMVVAFVPGKGITYTRGDGDHNLVTNNRLEASGYRDQRYMKASQVLAERKDASLETMVAVMDAVHQRGPGGFTSYSTVYNLKERKIHLFNLTDFGNVITLDLAEELAKGRHSTRMSAMFKDGLTLRDVKSGEQRLKWDTRIALSQAELKNLAGIYTPSEASDVEIRVEVAGEGLKVIVAGQPDAELYPEMPTVFRISPDRGQVTFHLNEDGTPEGFTLQRDVDLHAVWARGLE
ncbi:MAG: hypothetical protein COA73_16625 [Candidatus Hydrogenedentota bacterium]|nr:MAG: hypothetical protein COA73_16625 [Candidatus Hydrogenedentota bacterium]